MSTEAERLLEQARQLIDRATQLMLQESEPRNAQRRKGR